jgi:hypothetical protein
MHNQDCDCRLQKITNNKNITTDHFIDCILDLFESQPDRSCKGVLGKVDLPNNVGVTNDGILWSKIITINIYLSFMNGETNKPVFEKDEGSLTLRASIPMATWEVDPGKSQIDRRLLQ